VRFQPVGRGVELPGPTAAARGQEAFERRVAAGAPSPRGEGARTTPEQAGVSGRFHALGAGATGHGSASWTSVSAVVTSRTQESASTSHTAKVRCAPIQCSLAAGR
ncbi:hypothetical protein ACFUGD_28410, partial [Streptomyces sp. NPDC057217]|uniref:hypothetical protein n=1 Tax=Streptomyces sp. NPDC057217 TaxID=3346054 RepID=UPI00363A8EF5